MFSRSLTPDKGKIASLILFSSLAAVVPVERVAAGPMVDRDYAFVLTTDYWSAAYYSVIEVLPPRHARIDIQPVATDAIAYYEPQLEMIYVVNRFLADNVQLVDPNGAFATIGQYSVGNGANPHDIRLTSRNKAYVSRFDRPSLLVMDPTSGSVLDSIDMSPLADEDGLPEMDRLAMIDQRLFVTLNLLDRNDWQPSSPGKIAVIDLAADTLLDVDPTIPGIQAINLQYSNPYTELRYDPGSQLLVVGCLGAWGVLDGGVEIVDPLTMRSEGVLISEVELGGDVSDAVLTPEGKGYAVIMDIVPWPDNFARLVAFDAGTGEVTDTLYAQTSGNGASLATIELNNRGELYLCDRDAVQPGIRVFDTTADTLIALIDVGLPPYDVVFVTGTGGGGNGRPPAPLLRQNHPNPFNYETVIPFRLTYGTHARLDIVDARGRLVARLLNGLLPAGWHQASWSGRTDDGEYVPSGLYFCCLAAGGETSSCKMILAR